jgi:predicted nucleic acid-binding protein
MVQRFYFDTSVFGGVYDIEFDEASIKLFEKEKLGQVTCVYSDLTEGELFDAPSQVKGFFRDLPKSSLELVKLTPEAITLVQSYIAENVVGKTSFNDCIHIALATIHKVDILVSWNFKHIVNVSRIRGYNSVNLRSGYQTLDIRSPKISLNMTAETKKQIKEKDFDTVKTFRSIKERISKDIADMTIEQMQAYLHSRKVRLQD